MALDMSAGASGAGENGIGNGPAAPAGQVAIEVQDLEKTFQIPTEKVSRLKERLINPFARAEYRQLRALQDVSFEIGKGEFFGIVGRNGSGKSTLLKIMASIYAADGGRVRMAGRVAPFIELGVGFDLELTARENVVLSGVMMGLTPSEARRSFGQVIEFAELESFVDLKLKNYSSGMLVRLAFSVMVQADADVLLIDEVLAVGDAAFQQKCADQFRRMKKEGKTIVLVTHDMRTVEEYCHRALLLSGGRIVEIGDPGEVTRRYLRLNFEERYKRPGETPGAGDEKDDVRLLDIWLEGADGERINNVELGDDIRVRAVLEAHRDVPNPQFGFIIANADDVNVHEFHTSLPSSGDGPETFGSGQRIEVSANVKNGLNPGHYYLHHGVTRDRNRYDTALFAPHVLGFLVFGGKDSTAVVQVEHEMRVTPRQADGE
ncbi:MAG: ABC transporter ATP-binding protein [Solirubrobacterales bacterium]